jgi:hypothetical protein
LISDAVKSNPTIVQRRAFVTAVEFDTGGEGSRF